MVASFVFVRHRREVWIFGPKIVITVGSKDVDEASRTGAKATAVA
jgi:hypothetical protein